MWAEWLKHSPHNLSTSDRYALAGNYFKQIANQSITSFSDHLRNLTTNNLLARANALEGQFNRLKDHSVIRNSSWPRMVEQEFTLCRNMAISNSLLLPLESNLVQRENDEKLKVTQEWIYLYGKMIEAWPFLRSLMEQGSRDY